LVPAPSAITPLGAIAEDAAKRGRLALEALLAAPPAGRGDDHPAYLDLRRAIASAAPLWRRPGSIGGEALFGPLRSVDEVGGAMARLDAALVKGDVEALRREGGMIQRVLRLLGDEATRVPVSPSNAATALSLAAYDLGALALESTAGLPDGPSAVLADLRGTLDFIEHGARALAEEAGPAAGAALPAVRDAIGPLRAQLDAARSSLDLENRAGFVLQTGRLGVALRRLDAAAGLPARLPYRPRVASVEREIDEPICALTVPAPRLGPDGAPPRDEAYAELGRHLFFDRRLSPGAVRACATCHVPAKGYADGLARPRSLEQGTILRHTPTLLYTSLHAAQMWDGRTLTAARQALGVIHARAEMGLSEKELLDTLGAVEDYRARFAALPEPGITAENVGRALAAFEIHALAPADAPIDRFARGEEDALSAEERRGLDVFAGKGRCARCHIPPLFGGSRPRDFAVPVFAVIGVPEGPEGKALDPDRGRGAITHRAIDEGAFKTPTVRDVARTAPYFHNGKFATLEDVVRFYDKGGGAGLGLRVENQDPEVRKLGLSPEEIRALVVFMTEGLRDRTPPEALADRMAAPKDAPSPR
jgi:cytochrome c peroxidase